MGALTVSGTAGSAPRKSLFHPVQEQEFETQPVAAGDSKLQKGASRPLDQYDRVMKATAAAGGDLGLTVHSATKKDAPEEAKVARSRAALRQQSEELMASKEEELAAHHEHAALRKQSVFDSLHSTALGIGADISKHGHQPGGKRVTRGDTSASLGGHACDPAVVDISKRSGWTVIDQSGAATSGAARLGAATSGEAASGSAKSSNEPEQAKKKQAQSRHHAPPAVESQKTQPTGSAKQSTESGEPAAPEQPAAPMQPGPQQPIQPAGNAGATDVALNALKNKLCKAGWSQK